MMITKAVMGAMTTDEIVVYVNGHEKREWLRDLLQDDAREDVYIVNIDAHYEDMESLNMSRRLHILCIARNV